ncbi:MAG: single-stranded DNA-binding protein [Desulfovibrionales bacterium]|nr:MAG: single-stranded DNA-binding protein [Desulfovibrionales bacterium]
MAGTLNKVILIGRLGVTPELKYTAQGTPVTSFSLATDESYTDKTGNKVEQTEWHRIVVWQRQAENVCKFLQKGSLALVEGRLQTRKWQDQQGQDRYTTEIVAQQVTFLDSKQDKGQSCQGPGEGGTQYPESRQQGSEAGIDSGDPPF